MPMQIRIFMLRLQYTAIPEDAKDLPGGHPQGRSSVLCCSAFPLRGICFTCQIRFLFSAGPSAQRALFRAISDPRLTAAAASAMATYTIAFVLSPVGTIGGT